MSGLFDEDFGEDADAPASPRRDQAETSGPPEGEAPNRASDPPAGEAPGQPSDPDTDKVSGQPSDPDTDKVSGQPSEKYLVVARRYRPRRFADLLGQDHVVQALTNAIRTGRVGHAYLFTGARGVGKTSAARIFAKCLNAPGGPDPDPDLETEIARMIDAGEDVDVVEIDGASNRGIEEIRQLRANALVRPSRARYKIYIIDEVHMLTTPAFNALLKILEEPPAHVKFIFCTTDPDKIPITVRSRCQRFDFAPVALETIVERLGQIVRDEGREADPAALALLARRAGGSVRDSQSLLEQLLSFSEGRLTCDAVHRLLGSAGDERLAELIEAVAAGMPAAALEALDQADREGIDWGQLTEQLLQAVRDALVLEVGGRETLIAATPGPLLQALDPLRNRLGPEGLMAALQLLDHTLDRLRYAGHAR
ncbi:MAG TPA: DNA polymerase III subunit gamma/tau, partial [Bryobacterales bacterium]|nr:DNA polymerase III subunit gamma/tau [Bryobacterales bacterium]